MIQKPDFRDLKKLINAVNDTNNAIKGIYSDKESQEAVISGYCNKVVAEQAKESLKDYSVDELKNARAGIRVSVLSDAGYKSLYDIATAKDDELRALDGIGEKQIETIRYIITEFANSLSSKCTIILDTGEGSRDLVTALTRYICSEQVRSEAEEAAANLDNFAVYMNGEKIIRNTARWIFSGKELKEHTLDVVDDIYAFCDSPFFERLLHFLDLYRDASSVPADEALNRFGQNSADYYALLEKLGKNRGNKPFIYDSIPDQLASEVEATEPDLSDFKGNLRAYQTFGVKYILHQKKVLLGDEMGLGKTIQAIAAMSHIDICSPGPCYFLVVCPASVIINWAREIKKFSKMESYVIHGQGLEDSFKLWQEKGGVAVTNYESMGKIVDRIDNHMHLDMLVIDEAHYMKNPDAQRTMYIRRLDNESERILLMTGTPLENRVEEMCNLIDFVRPDMIDRIRSCAHLSHLPEFREILAPLYLRRTRNQVLTELPSIDERQEWCDISEADRTAYLQAISEKSFPQMRRIGFLQENLKTSSKATRLLELCDEAKSEGRKVVVYSFFRETLSKVSALLEDDCIGVISGDTGVEMRQEIIDEFAASKKAHVLVCQVQSGGVGLNIQSASIVIFCEPQIKPSLTWQALSRVYRMGQTRNVLIYHLLCPDTVDEAMVSLLEEKKFQFESFADESAVAHSYDNIMNKEWIQSVIEKERNKYLPMVINTD